MKKIFDFFYNWLNNAAGEHANPIAWKPLFKELWIVYAFVGFIVAAVFYHFTNTKNLGKTRQNWYFMIVFGACLGFLWAYNGFRLFGTLDGFINFGNFIGICLKATIWQLLFWYILGYYFFRIPFFKSKKRYLPTLLTFFLKPKNNGK